MSERDKRKRKVGSGYGPGSKRTQYVKGQSGNIDGRRRKRPEKGIGLRETVMKKVNITVNGKTKKVRFPIAHIQRIMERASKGDSKADQMMMQFYKELGLFKCVSDSTEESYEFTIKLGPKNKSIVDDADNSSPTFDDKG